MATLAVTNSFSSGTTIVASQMNTNFDDIESFINSSPGVLQLTGGTVSGAVIITSTLTVGADGTGHDVKLFGDTSGDYLEWDADTNRLNIVGTNGTTALNVSDGNVAIADDLDVDGTTNLDVVDIDGAVDMASTLTLAGNADFNGDLDVDGTTNLDVVDIDGAVDMASTLTLAGNADFNGDLDVDGTTNLDAVDIDGNVQLDGTFTVGEDDTGYNVKFFGATTGKYMLWDQANDKLTVSGTIDSTVNPPPIVETFASQSISASGTTVTFASSRFSSAPNVMVTQATSGGGGSKVPNVDNITSSSCRVFLLNSSGSFVSGDASLLATLEV